MSLTPEQFNKITTKDQFDELKDEIIDIKKDVKKILNSVDSIVGTHQEIGAERAANIGAHDRIEEEITKTNKRVTIVEKKLEAVHVSA